MSGQWGLSRHLTINQMLVILLFVVSILTMLWVGSFLLAILNHPEVMAYLTGYFGVAILVSLTVHLILLFITAYRLIRQAAYNDFRG